MEDVDPTVQRRRLRVELRRARTDAGLTQREVAAALDWSLSKLLRIEAGQVSISTTDLKALLDHYGVTDPDTVNEVRQLAQAGKRRTWSAYKDVLSTEFLIYLGYEGSASLMRQFENLFIPGLLQTPDYARALIKTLAKPNTPQHTIERQIEARIARQSLLDRNDHPEMFFILDEAVVRRWVGNEAGNPQVMRRQLERLIQLGGRPRINIQILPFGHGAHVGMRGPFVLLEFPDPQDDDLLFLENARGNVVTRDDTDEIERYKSAFWDLEKAATAPDDLASFIEPILSDMPAA